MKIVIKVVITAGLCLTMYKIYTMYKNRSRVARWLAPPSSFLFHLTFVRLCFVAINVLLTVPAQWVHTFEKA